ncbi:hypothetical protein IW261DRAFT_1506515 [Armillaria novae-zelandiae]|uniref:Uncharacterized protein n=1 Tax=Armillaria novae-zelandiae TaxID=153914 RepID=A0AA39NVK8_9AGAR|nr:hypothetical protein IW261DRAFT_1506515 [Armillaria novae-zelandiae]
MATGTYLLTDLPRQPHFSSRHYFPNEHTSICGPLSCRENSFDLLGTYSLDLSPPHRGRFRVSQSCLSDPQKHWIELKARLRNRLRTGGLCNIPSGFPFSLYPVSSPVRYEPYEVYEELFPSRRIFISFSPSNYANEQWFAWRISVCVDFGLWQTKTAFEGQRMVLAQVQMHSAVQSTPYWRFVQKDPSVILHALSASLELGVLITIMLGEMASREIIFVATNTLGHREILHLTKY